MPGDPSFLETLLIIASGAGDALHPIMHVYLNKELHSPVSTVLLLRSLILVIKINPNFQVFGGKRIFHEQFLAFFFFFLRTDYSIQSQTGYSRLAKMNLPTLIFPSPLWNFV